MWTAGSARRVHARLYSAPTTHGGQRLPQCVPRGAAPRFRDDCQASQGGHNAELRVSARRQVQVQRARRCATKSRDSVALVVSATWSLDGLEPFFGPLVTASLTTVAVPEFLGLLDFRNFKSQRMVWVKRKDALLPPAPRHGVLLGRQSLAFLADLLLGDQPDLEPVSA